MSRGLIRLCSFFLIKGVHACVRARAFVQVHVRATETRLIKKKPSLPFKQEFYRAVGYTSIPAPQSTPQIRKSAASSGAPPPHHNTTSPTSGTTRESESESLPKPYTAAAPSSALPTPPPPPPPPPPALQHIASPPPHDAAEWMEKCL